MSERIADYINTHEDEQISVVVEPGKVTLFIVNAEGEASTLLEGKDLNKFFGLIGRAFAKKGGE